MIYKIDDRRALLIGYHVVDRLSHVRRSVPKFAKIDPRLIDSINKQNCIIDKVSRS